MTIAPARTREIARVVVALTAVAAATALAATATAVGPHQARVGGDRPLTVAGHVEQNATAEGARLELIDQSFAVEPDGAFQLDYVLRGLEGDPLELTTTTTTTSTTTTTTPPPTTPGAPDVTPSATPPPAPTTTAPEPVRLTVDVLNYAPLATADAGTTIDVDALVGGDVAPSAYDTLGDPVDGVRIDLRPLATIDDDGNVSITLDIGTDVTESVEDRLKFERPGLYPIRVQILVGDPDDGRVVATAGTIVQRLPGLTDPPAAPPIDLAVVVATPPPEPNGTPVDAARTRAAFDAAVDFAAGFPGSAALALPPTIVADAAGASTAVADALAGDELIPSPVAALDVSSAVAAQRADTYTRLFIAGEELLTDAVPTTPTRRDVAIATSAVSGAGAQLLRELGARYIVMTDTVYRESIGGPLPPSDLFVEAALPDGRTMPLILLDPLAGDLSVDGATTVLESATAVEWSVAVLADMLLEQARADTAAAIGGTMRIERSRLLSSPDFAAPDARLLGALHALTQTTPSVGFTEASALTGVTDVLMLDGEEVTVTLPDTAGPSLTDRLAVLDATALTMISASSMLPADDPRPAEWTAELESLISTAYSDAEVIAATASMIAEAQRLTSAVGLPDPFTFTLTGRTGTIEIRLTNSIDEPLDVLVHLESTKLTFPDGDQIVTLFPSGETSVIVPVEARSNGTSSIDLVVSTPAGETLDDPVALTARVTALTGLGQVLTAGFVLVLVTWWFTHWRSRRRAALAAAATGGEPNDDEVESDSL